MAILQNDVISRVQNDPKTAVGLFGFGAVNVAFGHGLQQAHDMDLKILYSSRQKNLLPPLSNEIFEKLKKNPQAVLGDAIAKESRWMEAKAQRLVVDQTGLKDRWLKIIQENKLKVANFPPVIDTRHRLSVEGDALQKKMWGKMIRTTWETKFADLPDSLEKKLIRSDILNVRNDQRILHETANPSRARRLLSPRNFKMSGRALMVLGTGLMVYQAYNAYKQDKAENGTIGRNTTLFAGSTAGTRKGAELTARFYNNV